MDGIVASVAGQPWIGAVGAVTAAVIAAIIVVLTNRQANSWDKRRREAVKAELEIAKSLKQDFKDDDWKLWLKAAKAHGEQLLDPIGRRETRALTRTILWLIIGLTMLVITDKLAKDLPGTADVTDLSTVAFVTLSVCILATVLSAAYCLALLWTCAERFVNWSIDKSTKRQQDKRRSLDGQGGHAPRPELQPDDAGFLPPRE